MSHRIHHTRITPRYRLLLIVLPVFMLLPAINAAAFFRSNQEFRTINTDMYEISVARNGLTSVLLLSGEPVFHAAHVRYQLAGGRDQHANLPGRNTNRQEVEDRLGHGQGLIFGHRNMEWYIRAYPTKPFLAVQAVYTNNSRNPVRVERLTPWAVLNDRGGGLFTLGPGAENVRILPTMDDAPSLTEATGSVESEDSLVLYNPTTRRSLVAGFLTAHQGRGVISITRSPEAGNHAFDSFRADCVYDSPVVLAPGERLESEVFYLGLAEEEVLLGMERFGKAFAVVNGVREPNVSLPSGFRLQVSKNSAQPFATELMAWLDGSAASPEAEAHEAESADAMALNAVTEHFNTLVWGASWQSHPGSLTPDARQFPEGLAALTAAAQAKGYRSLLEITPLVTSDPTLHSETLPEEAWLPVKAASQAHMAPYTHVLDTTHPDAVTHLEQQMPRLIGWGFSGLVVHHADAAFHAQLPEDSATEVERVHNALRLLRTALPSESDFVVSPATLHTGLHADYALVDGGRSTAGDNRMALMQERYALSAARFHLTPGLFHPVYQGWPLPPTPDAPVSRLAWQQMVSQMALGGGAVLLPWHPEVSVDALAILNNMLPPSGKMARPANIAQDAAANVWHAPIYRDGKAMHLLGLQHSGGDQAQTVDVAFRSVGLDPNMYYTVFDLWQLTYYGTAQGALSVNVAPNNTRLLLLRPFENRPALQYIDNQSPPWSTRQGDAAWTTTQQGSLKGQFHAENGQPSRVLVSVPEPWRYLDAFSGPGEMQTTLADQMIELTVHPRHDGPVDWEIRFHDGRS